MGYDLHITRAFVSYESERFPILGTEVDELVRVEPDLSIPPDAPRRPDFCFVVWTAGVSDGSDHLLFHDGRLSTKNPRPAFRRRAIDLAARLDAWLIGDDSEVYGWDGDQVIAWQRGREAFAGRRYFITRGSRYGSHGPAPIEPAEWAALVAAQPDFVTMTRIDATLPSGVRAIACPPFACWTGHPSGSPVPFFLDDDGIEVRHADDSTVRRMAPLAAALGAEVVDDGP